MLGDDDLRPLLADDVRVARLDWPARSTRLWARAEPSGDARARVDRAPRVRLVHGGVLPADACVDPLRTKRVRRALRLTLHLRAELRLPRAVLEARHAERELVIQRALLRLESRLVLRLVRVEALPGVVLPADAAVRAERSLLGGEALLRFVDLRLVRDRALRVGDVPRLRAPRERETRRPSSARCCCALRSHGLAHLPIGRHARDAWHASLRARHHHLGSRALTLTRLERVLPIRVGVSKVGRHRSARLSPLGRVLVAVRCFVRATRPTAVLVRALVDVVALGPRLVLRAEEVGEEASDAFVEPAHLIPPYLGARRLPVRV